MKQQTGFTLMELMIVIALILIIAAIAIPSLKEAQISANETSAVGSIRAINTAEVSYRRPTEGMRIRWRIWEGRTRAQSQRLRRVCWIRAWLGV
jgi:prepilin-type N-terminal cleavage/methylation domain-containing protein